MKNTFSDAVLESTGDARDRTEEIRTCLLEKGVCILSPGVYFVSGIRMPEGSCLMGSGDESLLVLAEDVKEGCAVYLASYCRVSDLALTGHEGKFPRPEKVGARHGVGFLGTCDQKDGGSGIRHCMLRGLRIRNFSGGGVFCWNTGYNIECSMTASDLRIHGCGVGVWIARFSEYHHFIGVHANRNLYGCINCGGNNVFSASSFDGNTTGFLIDNSRKQSPNCAHGTALGCTFNHSDSGRGTGIRVLGAENGFLFTDCQCFASGIEVENSRGIQFVNFNLGKGQEIEVRGGGLVRFSGCVFGDEPVFRFLDAQAVVLENCYDRNGNPVRIPENEEQGGEE